MRFQTRPVVIEAVQFTEAMARGDAALPPGVLLARRALGPPPEKTLLYHRHILEDKHLTGAECPEVEIGDWIILSPGRPRVCREGIFGETYIAVEPNPGTFCRECGAPWTEEDPTWTAIVDFRHDCE